jgi:hypothetical protein
MASSMARIALAATFCVAGMCGSAGAEQQPVPPIQPPPSLRSPQPPPSAPDPVEKLGKGLFRLGSVRVDTNRKEVSVPGTINDVSVLEFLANTKGGFKNYESAIEAETSALTFNVALLLIGLDTTGVVQPPVDRGPVAPRGQELDVLVEWDEDGKARVVPAEELVTIVPENRTLARAAWIYTGSILDPNRKVLYADLDGVLIGFMHTRSSVIDHGATLEKTYGAYRLNTRLIKPGTKVNLVVRARSPK